MQQVVHSVKSREMTPGTGSCLVLCELRGTCNGPRHLSFSDHSGVHKLKWRKDDGLCLHGSSRDASVGRVEVCTSHQQVMQDELITMGEAFYQPIRIKDAACRTKIMMGIDVMY